MNTGKRHWKKNSKPRVDFSARGFIFRQKMQFVKNGKYVGRESLKDRKMYS